MEYFISPPPKVLLPNDGEAVLAGFADEELLLLCVDVELDPTEEVAF